jgi:tetratricopeptide (TPR) repeat protein
MPETISCPGCRRRLLLPEGLAGRTIQCPSCRHLFQAEAPPPVDVPAAVPPPPMLRVVEEALPPDPPAQPQIEDVLPADPPAEPEILEVLPANAPPAQVIEVSANPLRFDTQTSSRRRQGRPLRAAVVIVASALLVIGLIGLAFYHAVQRDKEFARERALIVQELAAERREQVIQAFQEEPQPVDDATAASLKPLFDGLGAAMRARDGNRTLNHFDLERMFDEMVGQGLLPPRFRGQRETFLRGVRAGMQQQLAQNAVTWKTYEIRSVKRLADDELVVIVRHRDDQNVTSKMRWWLKRRGQAWRIFDYEDLDMSMRASALMGSVLGLQDVEILRLVGAAPALVEALQAISAQHDAEAADKSLKRIAGTKLPRQLDAVRELVAALIHSQRSEYQQALDALDRAGRLQPDMPILDLLRGTTLNQLRRWNEAVTRLQAYQKLLGDDANVCLQLGLAHHYLEHYAEARANYRKTLDDDPTSLEAYRNLVRALGDEDARDDLAPRFVKLGNYRDSFAAVLEECREFEDHASLEPIALEMQKLDPDHALAYHSLALARVWAGKIPQALPPFRTALAKDPAGRQEFVKDLAKTMVRSRKGTVEQWAAGLAVIDQPGEPKLSQSETDLLKGILCSKARKWAEAVTHLQACRKELADDAALRYQLALSLHFLNRFEEARAEYRQVLDLDPKHLEAMRNLVRALGSDDDHKDVGARFARLDQPQAHFDTLVDECRDVRNWKALEEIALAMQKLDPKFPGADLQLALAKIGQGQTDQGLVHLNAAVAKDPEKRKIFYNDVARSLVLADKAEEAYKKLGNGRELFPILVAELLKLSRPLDLRRLVAAHAAQHPDDPLLPFCRGELHADEEDYLQADKEFTAGMARPPDAALLQLFRRSRVLARFYAGHGLAAYEEIGPVDETFGQLAALAYYQKDDVLLEKLLALHGPKHPNSVELHRYRFRSKIRQEQPAEAIALFKAALEKVPSKEHDGLTNDFLRDMAEAGHALDAYRAAPEPDEAFQQLASALLGDDDYPGIAKLIEVHRQADADDPWLTYYRGMLLMHDKAWDQASQVLREGLRTAPEDARYRLRWNYVRAMYEAGKSVQAYREADDKAREDVFNQLANLLLNAKKAKELQELIEAHRPHAAAQPGEVLFFEAQVRFLQKKPAEAIPLIQQACEKETRDYRRNAYVRRFVLEMKAAGQLLEGYRAAPDKGQAFQTLAQALVSDKNAKELEALLRAHATNEPDDDVELYRGELCLLQGKVKDAEQIFAAALGGAGPDRPFRLRYPLFRTRLQLGKIAETYREFGAETFETLAYLCINQKDAAALESLIAARRQERPDPNLLMWDVELQLLKKDYLAAWKLLSTHRQGILGQPRHRWKAEDYLVRCLIKLQRFPEAAQEAERICAGPGNHRVLLVLAHAATGDVDKAIAALDKAKRPPWLIRSCYDDDDLGPILKGDPFKPFRDKFPRPEPEPDIDDLD